MPKHMGGCQNCGLDSGLLVFSVTLDVSYDHRDPKGDHSYEDIPYHISGPSRQTEINE